MRGVRWVVPKENGGYSFMLMRKRLDCGENGWGRDNRGETLITQMCHKTNVCNKKMRVYTIPLGLT